MSFALCSIFIIFKKSLVKCQCNCQKLEHIIDTQGCIFEGWECVCGCYLHSHIDGGERETFMPVMLSRPAKVVSKGLNLVANLFYLWQLKLSLNCLRRMN